MTTAVNVNRPKSFLDAAQREKLREREARESGLMFSRDRLIEMIPVRGLGIYQYIHVLQIRGIIDLSLVTCTIVLQILVKGRYTLHTFGDPYHIC